MMFQENVLEAHLASNLESLGRLAANMEGLGGGLSLL